MTGRGPAPPPTPRSRGQARLYPFVHTFANSCSVELEQPPTLVRSLSRAGSGPVPVSAPRRPAPDRSGVLAQRGPQPVDDPLGGGAGGEDLLHAVVPQGASHDLGPTVVPIQSRLGDHDPNPSLRHRDVRPFPPGV